MHVYFSGIGGAGIGPLALIAHEAGYDVSGSDKQDSAYIQYLKDHDITDVHIGQGYEQIAAVHAEEPIDWYVYSSAIAKEQSDAPEFQFCRDNDIKTTKRDEFLSRFIADHNLQLVAVAGTHGKTTTTAMAIWLFKQLDIPVSYSVGGKLSFGDMGEYDPESSYFVYEADEFDHNFLSFHPHLSLIAGIDYDHADTYPTRESYMGAFRQFLDQSRQTLLWKSDAERLGLQPQDDFKIFDEHNSEIDQRLHLPGVVNRQDAWQVAQAMHALTGKPLDELCEHLNRFPGVGRRFEKLAPNIYSDYAHTPPKIRGALQLAHEVGGENVVVVYEGLHNTRQHFIKDELYHLFEGLKNLYVVPSYLAREDPNLALLSPDDLIKLCSPEVQKYAAAAGLDEKLLQTIQRHAAVGDLVLCITAGGGGSLDEWLRKQL